MLLRLVFKNANISNDLAGQLLCSRRDRRVDVLLKVAKRGVL